MLSLMTPEWQAEMKDVEYTVRQVAAFAKVSASTAAKVMTGENTNYGRQTEVKLKSALKFLRGYCPRCGQKMPRKDDKDAALRRCT